MTKQETTGRRDLTFSAWIRVNLPDSSTGFQATDIDFVLRNWRTKKLMLLEIKTFHTPIKKWQQIVFSDLDVIFKNGIKSLLNWEYLGWHLVMFEGNDFTQKVFFDDAEVTENELKNILSF